MDSLTTRSLKPEIPHTTRQNSVLTSSSSRNPPPSPSSFSLSSNSFSHLALPSLSPSLSSTTNPPRVTCFFPTDNTNHPRPKLGPTTRQTSSTLPPHLPPPSHSSRPLRTPSTPLTPLHESTSAFWIRGSIDDGQPKRDSDKPAASPASTNDPCSSGCSFFEIDKTQKQMEKGRSLSTPSLRALASSPGNDGGETQKERVTQNSAESRSSESASCATCFRGWAVAAQFAKKDAAIVKRGLLSLDSRARQDVEKLRSGVNFLDARARADTGKLNSSAMQRLRRMRSFALGMEEVAKMEFLQAAQQHREANGALMADLQIADVRARRRALEDAYLAWQATKQVHDSLVKALRVSDGVEGSALDTKEEKESETSDKSIEEVLAELRSRPLDPMERWYSSATVRALLDSRDADVEERSGIISSSEELEFLLAALLDLDEVSEGSGALLLSQQVDSPDVSTRQAIVNVLAAAPSLWALGNAGMGALQRLSRDDNPGVAAAASEALSRLWNQFTQEKDH